MDPALGDIINQAGVPVKPDYDGEDRGGVPSPVAGFMPALPCAVSSPNRHYSSNGVQVIRQHSCDSLDSSPGSLGSTGLDRFDLFDRQSSRNSTTSKVESNVSSPSTVGSTESTASSLSLRERRNMQALTVNTAKPHQQQQKVQKQPSREPSRDWSNESPGPQNSPVTGSSEFAPHLRVMYPEDYGDRQLPNQPKSCCAVM